MKQSYKAFMVIYPMYDLAQISSKHFPADS